MNEEQSEPIEQAKEELGPVIDPAKIAHTTHSLTGEPDPIVVNIKAVRRPKKRKETKADRLQNAAQAVLDAVEEANTELQELADAYTAAQSAYEEIRSGLEGTLQGIEDALQNLRDVREEEYQGWYDNLNEGLQRSPVGQKLEELLAIDLEPSMPELMELPDWEELEMSEVENAAQEILDADLPQGFGRD